MPSRAHAARLARDSSASHHRGEERSIAESLALIKQHVNILESAPDVPSAVSVLAPPPGFSDSDAESSSKVSRVSQLSRAFSQQQQSDPLRVERQHASLAKQAASKARSDAPFDMSRSLDLGNGGGRRSDFRGKALAAWTSHDVCDWLDSLFMPEHKPSFLQKRIDGARLAALTDAELQALGVLKVGHTINIRKSLSRHVAAQLS